MKGFIKSAAVMLLLLAGGILFVLSNTLWGFRAFIVTSGSMTPAISTGSLVITHYNHPDVLQRGDIITFMPPVKEREFVTHRITKISHIKNLSLFKTKGDSNKQEDVWTLAGGAVVGKVVIVIPYIGYFFSFIKSKIGILLFILLPTVFIIVNEIVSLITILKHHKKNTVTHETTPFAIVAVFFTFALLTSHYTSALLSDTAGLSHNALTIIQSQCNTNQR